MLFYRDICIVGNLNIIDLGKPDLSDCKTNQFFSQTSQMQMQFMQFDESYVV